MILTKIAARVWLHVFQKSQLTTSQIGRAYKLPSKMPRHRYRGLSGQNNVKVMIQLLSLFNDRRSRGRDPISAVLLLFGWVADCLAAIPWSGHEKRDGRQHGSSFKSEIPISKMNRCVHARRLVYIHARTYTRTHARTHARTHT